MAFSSQMFCFLTLYSIEYTLTNWLLRLVLLIFLYADLCADTETASHPAALSWAFGRQWTLHYILCHQFELLVLRLFLLARPCGQTWTRMNQCLATTLRSSSSYTDCRSPAVSEITPKSYLNLNLYIGFTLSLCKSQQSASLYVSLWTNVFFYIFREFL